MADLFFAKALCFSHVSSCCAQAECRDIRTYGNLCSKSCGNLSSRAVMLACQDYGVCAEKCMVLVGGRGSGLALCHNACAAEAVMLACQDYGSVGKVRIIEKEICWIM